MLRGGRPSDSGSCARKSPFGTTDTDQGPYCEAWNDTGVYTYDRLGRGTLRIEAWFGETSPRHSPRPSWRG